MSESGKTGSTLGTGATLVDTMIVPVTFYVVERAVARFSRHPAQARRENNTGTANGQK